MHRLCLDNNDIVKFHATHFFVKEAQSKRVMTQRTLCDGFYKLEGKVHKHFPYLVSQVDNISNEGTFLWLQKLLIVVFVFPFLLLSYMYGLIGLSLE